MSIQINTLHPLVANKIRTILSKLPNTVPTVGSNQWYPNYGVNVSCYDQDCNTARNTANRCGHAPASPPYKYIFLPR